ncbi:fructose-1,6-bisphosphatase [Clostridium fallax]|uniref:Fructose-1,6-bisphosphatase class 3 n=1 Tax=Clostridium fallax TaxID=1533 RepID=A0A1M4Z0W8_9CLOT|nr:fructose-1,6-bisphosphatase [Clostridium fallax]SHF11236.1 fructose-1,6-bisphosphatase-3 [Clostridium fallax]SQB07367.1 fructose-bisphosphatase [Clostridium fallax]
MDFEDDRIDITNEGQLRYLTLLSYQYPNIAAASTEIINLQAILNLPKGTEHFLTDIHGEYRPFIHVLKNASGVIKRKIEKVFGNSISAKDKKSLATLIYYPEQKIELILKEEENIDDWYKINLFRLIELCRDVSSKYTRSKVRKALPKDFEYIIEELLHEKPSEVDKKEYYNEIINTIISIDRAKDFITALSNLIQRLVIDRLHILGDIYDRGPGAHIILDYLSDYHSVDFQWGNHDIVWMGAAAGSEVCIANVLRISARYANLDTVEDGYGINMLPLATFALDFYKNDPCNSFKPKLSDGDNYSVKEIQLISKMHKAIAIIQFKLEGQLIKRRREFNLNNRLMLDKIDYSKGTISLDGKEYELNDKNFPTINPKSPYDLTKEEQDLIYKLKSSFVNSDKLQKHIRFLYAKGSMYLRFNGNLLFHGSIPITETGNFKEVEIKGHKYKGKALLDELDRIARVGYFSKRNSKEKEYGEDMLWYLWLSPNSPLFGKDKMTTFERYFINDKRTHKENKTLYYKLTESEEICNKIIKEFGLNVEESHIINGHVPVESKKGESPIKANGKLLIIDGGFSRAYQGKTGIGGYTLIYNSMGLQLVSHEPFKTIEDAVLEETDILSSTVILERQSERKTVGDTDVGKSLKLQIDELKKLLIAYRKGLINEKIEKNNK